MASSSKSARMAKVWQFSQGHPKPAFSEKVEKGGLKGNFSKIARESSPRMNGLRALLLSSNPLKVQRLEKILAQKALIQKCPNGQVIEQFSQGHPKPAFSEKVQREDQGKFFKNHPKSGPPLKNPTALWRKWHYPLISMHL